MTQLKFINRPAAKPFDSFFNDLFSPAVWSTPSSDVSSIPAANVHETPTAYVLEISAPGRNKEDFKITVDKNILTVSFEKKEEVKDENKKQVKREFTLQPFKRSFTLDDKVVADNIAAKYENGLLLLSIPKKEEVKVEAKQIAVN